MVDNSHFRHSASLNIIQIYKKEKDPLRKIDKKRLVMNRNACRYKSFTTAPLFGLQRTHLYISHFLKHIPLPNEGDYFM